MKILIQQVVSNAMFVPWGVISPDWALELSPYGTDKASVLEVDFGRPVRTQLQGQDTYASTYQFGGIYPDNSATGGPQVISSDYMETTYVPNVGAPLMDAVYVNNVGIAKIERFVDNNIGSIIADPDGVFGSQGSTGGYFLTTFVGAPKRMRIICNAKDTYIGFMGDVFSGYNGRELNLVLGEGGDLPMQPIVVKGSTEPVTIISEY
jgi:hypothetical protein